MFKQIYRIIFCSIVILGMTVGTVFAADNFPGFPMSFYGHASLDGQLLPSGYVIEAYAEELLVGSIVINEAGVYGYDKPTKEKLVVAPYSGDITFMYRVSDLDEAQTGESVIVYQGGFNTGQSVSLNMPFTSTVVEPEEKPSPGGSGGSVGGRGANPTIADVESPASPERFRYNRDEYNIVFSWVNPSAQDFAGIILAGSPTSINDSIKGGDLEDLEQVLYRGMGQIHSRIDLHSEETYFYAIASYDKSGNYSDVFIMSVEAINGEGQSMSADEEREMVKVRGIEYSVYDEITTLANLDSSIVEEVSRNEALLIFQNNQRIEMSEVNKDVYDKVSDGGDVIDITTAYSKAYFIEKGTKTTKHLGSGERGGALNSYVGAFGKFPTSQAEWQDVVKIANGRWPTERSDKAESRAKIKFKEIYLRDADMGNVNDNAAVTVIAYGLRPAQRNMESEKIAIKTFKYIFGYNSSSALDWDMVRAIAYSGAIR